MQYFLHQSMNKYIISEVYLNLKSSYTIQAKMWKYDINMKYSVHIHMYFSLLFTQHLS